MAFNSKDDAKNNMNSNITTPTEPHLTPVGTTNTIRATNLKNWLNELLDWVFPISGTSLKGKSPIVSTNNTNYGAITWEQLVPIGTVMPWAGSSSTPPDGFLFCDGTLVSDTTYADLFAIIGNNYGVAPSGQFLLPRMQGSVPLGFDSGSSISPNSGVTATQSNYGKVGNRGGLRNVTLQQSQLASHTHGSNYTAASGNSAKHLHTVKGKTIFYKGGGGVVEALMYAGTQPNGAGLTGNPKGTPEGNHSHSVTGSSKSAGGNSAHENRMPYVVMKYIIKT